MNEAAFKDLSFTLLGKSCEYQGDINLVGETIVNCKVKGTITVKDESKLTIERDAVIEGNVYCQDIEVFGVVNGSISSSGSLTIRSSAKIYGNINAAKMSIYPGAILNMEGTAGSDEGQSTDSPSPLSP
jgi:cytoskeletal protein CcmA (bactofilin family)